MIIDRIQLAGLDAYFQEPAGEVNLGTSVLAPIIRAYPLTVRTRPLTRGKQIELSGIQLLIEGNDLRPLFAFQPSPILQFSVMKEMFTGLFADPFRHRVHNIAGYLDFKKGTLTNGTILEIDGIPTICSVGKEECIWKCKYTLPESINIDSVAWELATSRLIARDSFNYKIDIVCRHGDGRPSETITTGPAFISGAAPRFNRTIMNDVISFEITFRALVNQDSFVSERQLPTINEKTGRPLLRAINILEAINSSFYDIYSLTELKTLCNDFQISETPGTEIKRILATLDLSALLVNSENQTNALYEFIELSILTNQFTRLEAKRNGVDLRRNIS